MCSPDEVFLGRWLDLLLDVLPGLRPHLPWEQVCHELGAQLHASVVGHLTWSLAGEVSVDAYPMPEWFDLRRDLQDAPRLHPLARYYSSHNCAEVRSTTEVPFTTQGPEGEYFQLLRRDRIEQHLWVPVSRFQGRVDVLMVCRSRHQFEARDLAIAALVQRLLLALNVHICQLSGWTSSGCVSVQATGETCHLTPRQVSVLHLVADGLTSTAIGHRLRISPRTVERHIQDIYDRLHVSDRVSAVRAAARAGVISLSP